VWLHVPEHNIITGGHLLEDGASLRNLDLHELYAKASEAGIQSSTIADKILGATQSKMALVELLADEVLLTPPPLSSVVATRG
jgi:hypothetical protein